MPLISVDIMKTIDEKELQNPAKKTRQNEVGWELNDFVLHLS